MEENTKSIQKLLYFNNSLWISYCSFTYNYWDGNITCILDNNTRNLNLPFNCGLSDLTLCSLNNIIIGSSYDGCLYIITNNNNKSLQENQIIAHNTSINCIDYSSITERCISCSFDGEIKLWNFNDDNILLQQCFEYYQQRRQLSQIKWRPNEKQFVSVGENANILLWDINSCEPCASLKEKYCSLSISWCSNDNNTFVCGREDGSIQFIDIRKFDSIIEEYNIHNDEIRTIKYSPNNEKIICGSDDGTYSVINSLTKNIDYHSKQRKHFIRTIEWKDNNNIIVGDWNGDYSYYKH